MTKIAELPNYMLYIFTKAQPYPSEQAAVEQEKVQNQFTEISKQIEKNKSNVDLVKTELKEKIEHQATVTQKKVHDQLTEVSEQIEEVKSNADMVKMTLEKKIDQLVEVEQEKVQNQLTTMSAKFNEIDNRKEPVIAFRATVVKDVGSSNTESVYTNPGKISCLRSLSMQ